MNYTIKQGDTLGALAKRYGLTVNQLASFNGISNPDRIRAGNTLQIPTQGDIQGKASPALPTKNPDRTPGTGGNYNRMPVLYKSEFDALHNAGKVPEGAVVLPDPPPPPPPTVMDDRVKHPYEDETGGPGVDMTGTGSHPSPWQQAMSADPVHVLNNLGPDEKPSFGDYARTAFMALGPEGGAGLPEAAPRIPRPMAGSARDLGDNAVGPNLTPRSLLNNRFVKADPGSAGGEPLSPPPWGRAPRAPITVDPATGRFRQGRLMDIPPDPGAMGLDTARTEPYFSHGGRTYAMGGSPFSQLGNDAPGQPVEDVGDVINMNDYLHSPDFLANQQMHAKSGLPPRTFYGGSAGRLGSRQGNADYERANDLEPGSLVESNAGRGDVVNMPEKLRPRSLEEINNDPMYGSPISAKQAGQVERNQVSAIKGYMTSGNADVNQMKSWMNNPEMAPLVDRAIDGLSDEDFAAFRKNWNASSPDPDDHFSRGGYAFGGSPFNVERAASIGLQREGRAGFLNSGVPGRTDQIGLQVRNGSYVIPADVVSAAGQGNSLAGASAFDKLLKQGPYGTSMPNIRASRPAMPQMPRMQMGRPIPTGGRGINNFGQAMKMPRLPGQASGGGMTKDTSRYTDKNTTTIDKNFNGVPSPGIANKLRTPSGSMDAHMQSLINTPHDGAGMDYITDPQQMSRGYALASGGAAKKPRELVAPKEGNYSAGGVSRPLAASNHRIPILAAGGEYIVEPETVARVGNGDQQKGFRILDKLVLLTRKKHIDTLKKLKPPKKK